MKKYLFAMLTLVSLTAAAQGKFDIQNFDGYTVHVYQPSDSNAESSLIIESRSGLVVLGASQDASFKEYLEKFTKPVAQTVDANAPLGTIQNWNGVDLAFNMSTYGSDNADVIVGRNLYFVHDLPTMAHASSKVIGKAEDIDAQLNAAAVLLNSGCSKFVDEQGRVSDTALPRFLQKYYNTMKKAYKKASDANAFVSAIEKAFPKIEGKEDLRQVAQKLY